jgi:hypothetical protein
MNTLRKSLALAIGGLIALPTLCLALPPLLRVTIFNGGHTPISNNAETSGGYLSRSLAGTGGDGRRAESEVAASFGVLRAKTLVDAPGVPGSPENSVTARYRDNRVTNAPGRTGQAGFVTIKFTITGNLVIDAISGPGDNVHRARARFELWITSDAGGPSGGSIKEQGIYANGQPYGCDACAEFLNIEQTVTYPVIFGTPYDFDLLLIAGAGLRAFTGWTGGRVVADLGSTATYGGIVSVTDANGNPITDYTDTSTSGTNYVGPIVPQCATPPTTLAGWWPGDGNATDIRGSNNGTLQSGATFAAGRVGQAFSFPGAGARIRVPHAAALDFNATQDYTVDFWMKAGPQSAPATLVEKNGGTYPYSVQLLPTGFITAGFSDGTSPTSVTSTGTPGKVDNNLWRHVAVLFRHSTQVLELYVDGALNASQSYTATIGPLANGQDLYFGARSDGSNALVGSLDEVDISSGALTLSEIQSIAAAAGLGKCRPAVLPTSVVSRKTHGMAGEFDIILPLSGTPAVEGRGTDGNHRLVFTFPSAVSFSGAVITSGTATSATATALSPTQVAVDLAGVTDQQWLTVTLQGVSEELAANDVAVRVGFLTGDTNGSGGVNATDIGQTKAQSGQTVTAANFRQDVNVSGASISASDIGLVKARSGNTLPPP